MSGDTIGGYRLVRELGSGGMGTVYEAVDIMLERSVAIKMLRPEIASQPDLIERFRAEAITLAKLNHPSIATLYAFLHEGERFAMVMEYVRGRTLEGVLSAIGRMQPELAAQIVRQMLDGVAHAHGMSVLHRDIKPANVMVTAERAVKVTDFGIARLLGASRMTREGRIIGTLEYIAPERVRGEEEDPRSDLYSAGVVLFELLAGRLPFISDTDFGLLQAHLEQAPPELTALGVKCPTELQRVLSKALAKAPSDRYQSAQEFRDALTGATASTPAMKPTRLAGGVDNAQPLPPTRLAAVPEPSTQTRKAPDLLVAAIAVVLIAAGIGAIFQLRSRGTTAEPPVAAATVPAVSEPAPAAPPVQQPPPAIVFDPPVFIAPAGSSSAPQEPVKPAPRIENPVQRALPATPKQSPVQGPVVVAQPPAPIAVAPEVKVEAEPPPAPKPPRPKKLRAIQGLYIDKMANELDVYIRDEIRRRLPGLRLVARRADADAVMRGKVEKHGDAGSTVTRGYLGLKSEYSAEVRITDIDGEHQLWSGEAGDSRALIGAIKRGGPKKVAERLVSDLRKAMER
jgi:serine/threonine-protein kinase